MARNAKIATTGRSPIAIVEDQMFVDVLYGFGGEIAVDWQVLAKWLARQDPMNVFVGRRLKKREVKLLREAEIDAADEVYVKLESDSRRRRLGVTVP